MSAAVEQEQEPHLRMPQLPLPPPSECLRPAAKTALACSVLELVLEPELELELVLEPAIAAPCQQVARPPTRDRCRHLSLPAITEMTHHRVHCRRERSVTETLAVEVEIDTSAHYQAEPAGGLVPLLHHLCAAESAREYGVKR